MKSKIASQHTAAAAVAAEAAAAAALKYIKNSSITK